MYYYTWHGSVHELQFLYCRKAYVSYILEMVAIVNYNVVLSEDLCDLHTE